MLTDDYTVRLEQFQGPLDLLLYLARKAEVDVVDIPIAKIADQYVEHLTGIERIDIDLAGEFLVMAATLMELKSRLLMPVDSGASPDLGEGEDDPRRRDDEAVDLRTELIQQLLAYKEFRDAADALERRRDVWARRFPAGKAATDRDALLEAAQRRTDAVDLEDIGLFDLVEAYERVLERVNFDLLGSHHVVLEDDDTPIEAHAQELVERLTAANRPMSLREVFEGHSRGQVVGLFVATLELVRQRRITIDQRAESGEYIVSIRADAEQDSPEPTGHDFH